MITIATSILLRRSRSTLIFAMTALGLALPLQAKPKAGNSPMIRIVCVAAIPGDDEYVLASRGKKGKWDEHESLNLRSSFITPWLQVPSGELSLCAKKDGELVSRTNFSYPEHARRLLLVLFPSEDKEQYTTRLIDTAKQPFGKGDILVINASSKAAKVMLGENQVDAKPDESSVHKPKLDDKGMYHQLVTYHDEEGNVQTCSDGYIPGNDSSRDFLILLPDPQVGIRISSLSDFGPFE